MKQRNKRELFHPLTGKGTLGRALNGIQKVEWGFNEPITLSEAPNTKMNAFKTSNSSDMGLKFTNEIKRSHVYTGKYSVFSTRYFGGLACA